MTITDIIALAKQGYKPSDIKELISMTQAEPSVESEADNTTETKTEEVVEAVVEEIEADRDSSRSSVNTKVADPQPSIDEMKLQIQQLKEDLKKAQQVNVSQTTTQTSSNEDDLKELFRDFM